MEIPSIITLCGFAGISGIRVWLNPSTKVVGGIAVSLRHYCIQLSYFNVLTVMVQRLSNCIVYKIGYHWGWRKAKASLPTNNKTGSIFIISPFHLVSLFVINILVTLLHTTLQGSSGPHVYPQSAGIVL
jgi:hypothetical protein